MQNEMYRNNNNIEFDNHFIRIEALLRKHQANE